jgi:ribosomal protein L37AE/L43A
MPDREMTIQELREEIVIRQKKIEIMEGDLTNMKGALDKEENTLSFLIKRLEEKNNNYKDQTCPGCNKIIPDGIDPETGIWTCNECDREVVTTLFDKVKDKWLNGKGMRIRKVLVLSDRIRHLAYDLGCSDNDLVLVTVEKIEGSPTDFIVSKMSLGKPKTTKSDDWSSESNPLEDIRNAVKRIEEKFGNFDFNFLVRDVEKDFLLNTEEGQKLLHDLELSSGLHIIVKSPRDIFEEEKGTKRCKVCNKDVSRPSCDNPGEDMSPEKCGGCSQLVQPVPDILHGSDPRYCHACEEHQDAIHM